MAQILIINSESQDDYNLRGGVFFWLTINCKYELQDDYNLGCSFFGWKLIKPVQNVYQMTRNEILHGTKVKGKGMRVHPNIGGA